MATVVGLERRRTDRLTPDVMGWHRDAVLRPGQSVAVLNINGHGALVESAARLRPGAHTELQLVGASCRRSVRGRVARCHVAALEPLRYRGAIVFAEGLAFKQASGSE